MKFVFGFLGLILTASVAAADVKIEKWQSHIKPHCRHWYPRAGLHGFKFLQPRASTGLFVEDGHLVMQVTSLAYACIPNDRSTMTYYDYLRRQRACFGNDFNLRPTNRGWGKNFVHSQPLPEIHGNSLVALASKGDREILQWKEEFIPYAGAGRAILNIPLCSADACKNGLFTPEQMQDYRQGLPVYRLLRLHHGASSKYMKECRGDRYARGTRFSLGYYEVLLLFQKQEVTLVRWQNK